MSEITVASYGGGRFLAAQLGKWYTLGSRIEGPGAAGNSPGMSQQEVIPVAMRQYIPIPQLTQEQTEYFWAKVDRSGGPEACWPWRGKPNEKGYGRFGLNYRIFAAHRIAYALGVAPPPTDQCVCHACDNPICCNPAHHFLGTVEENNRDMWGKGRGKITHQRSKTTFSKALFAERGHPRSKVTIEQVGELRRLRGEGWTLRMLADRYGISQTSASKIADGQSYKHVR